ncbi:hypothetical protein [Microbacterium sp. NPDC057650]|uniref:hypothetical protein n=1 Tax=unclassified Microbacterium TaxID=2609290 RepID=UPI00366C6A2F
MYIDPMGAILIHRLETEQNLVRAERRRLIAERDAERRSTDEEMQHEAASVEGDKRMTKFRLFHLAS